MGGIFKNIELISRIASSFGRQTVDLSAVVTGEQILHIWSGSGGRGIWQTGPQNLEKFTAENCSP